jgi:DNA-directed RNA polymerase beta subunit
MPEAPAEQEQPTTEAEAPETDQPTVEEESFTDSYNPNEVPEEARPQLEAAYKQLQSAYTQKTQGLAEVRREAEQAQQLQDALRNPEVAPMVLKQLGYTEKEILEMFGYQPEEDDDLPPDETERLDRLEQSLSQREAADQAAQQEEAVTDYIAEQIEALETEAGREFDAEEHQLLDTFARANADQQGYPNVKGGYGLLSGILSNREKALLDPKRTTQRRPGNGSSGSRTVDLSKETPEERRERMASAVGASQASQE